MKKALSIILSLIMLVSVFALPASAEETVVPAEECTCEDHVAENCTCCLYCPNFDDKYKTSCVKEVEIEAEDGTKVKVYTVCCADCSGIFPCECLCACCDKSAEDTPVVPSKPPFLTPDQQDDVIATFQEVMQKVVEFFNEFFNYIFEFLKFTDIMNPEEGTAPTE